jgi:Mrp family chromosome partitioning ATPase
MLRGPIATRVINQLVHNTEWGDIDYMVLAAHVE